VPEAIGRAAAARELGREGSPQATAALKDALLSDKFWGVQADAAAALGDIRTDAALAVLIEGLQVKHPKARRAAARALGLFRDSEQAASALAGVLERGDESYFVEAEAALALGKTRVQRALEILERALQRPSYLDVIRAHALAGIAESRDERALALGREWSAYGKPPRARVAALGTLAKVARQREAWRDEIVDYLMPFSDDCEFMVRMRLPSAFEELGDPRAMTPLQRLADRDLDGRIQRRARAAITAIGEGRNRTEQDTRVREDLDKLRDDNKKLQQRVEKLETLAKNKDA